LAVKVPELKFASIQLVEDDIPQRNGWYWSRDEAPHGDYTGPWATAKLAEKDAKRKGYVIREIKQ
jgi:hypothetical protein